MNVPDHPWLIFLLAMLAFSASAWLGVALQKNDGDYPAPAREDFGVVLAAALTLLGLIIGFTFSMAISRYDLRKNYEEAEANAIGTEYVRTDFLPDAIGAQARSDLRAYVAERLRFYTAVDAADLRGNDERTGRLQKALWSDVKASAMTQRDPVTVLTVSGMNDVLNSQGYTQAAWWNRIPIAAWGLMAAIAVVCNTMLGYHMRPSRTQRQLQHLLPFVLAVCFFLIADIDSPRGGIIRVAPHNLLAVANSLN
jgi:hypothetical protein